MSYRRFWENRRTHDSLPTKAHALITNLLSLISPSVHLMISGTRPLVKASLSRRRPLITRCRSIKQTAVWRLSSFSPGKFCELRDFAYGQNLYVLYAKFPPPKAKRLQLVMPPTPQGRMIVFATAICHRPLSRYGREINIKSVRLYNSLRASSHNLSRNENLP